MIDERTQALSELLNAQQLGWTLTWRDDAVAGLLATIDASSAEYTKRFGTPADLLSACRAQPEVMCAYLQSLAESVSPAFLAMVARILLRSAEVVALQADFRTRQSIHLKVEIADPDGAKHSFESTALWDAQVFRHFGLMSVSGAPVIDGYYAVRIPEARE